MSGVNFKADPNDDIIIIMGPTGTGKSNFINTITGKTEAASAGGLESDTQSVIPYVIPHKGGRLVLVDTPGFDDTYRSDFETLSIIAEWFTQKYPNGEPFKATGVMYFHRITDQRMMGSVCRNLQMFGRICGDIPQPWVRLVTTMWDRENDQAAAERRENELRNKFWKLLLDRGAIMQRFNNTEDSAWAIVQGLLDMGRIGFKLLLQEELVELKMPLNETEAAKTLRSWYEQLLKELKDTKKELETEIKRQNNPTLAKSLQGEYEKVNAQQQKAQWEMEQLKTSLSFSGAIRWLRGAKPRAQPITIKVG